MIHIAIAEDNAIALKALEEKLAAFDDIRIRHTAPNGEALLKRIETDARVVDLVLMDIEMPVMNGIEAAASLKEKFPSVKIVMVTVYDDDDYIFNSIRAGADSYILKDTRAEKIYETICDTLNGGAVMSPSIAMKTLQLLKGATGVKLESPKETISLSDRETEILSHVSKGFSNKTVAEKLFISPFTVKRHLENIYRKLQSHNRIELVDNARRQGLI